MAKMMKKGENLTYVQECIFIAAYKAALKTKNATLEDVAKVTGLSPNYLKSYATQHGMSNSLVYALSEALGINLDAIRETEFIEGEK